MVIKIPNQSKKFQQISNTDVLGNIWSSFCLDFSENMGRIRVGKRMLHGSSTSTTNANLGVPVSFALHDDDRIWAVAGTRMFYNTSVFGTWAQDAAANTPTDLRSDSDLEIFNGRLYVHNKFSNLYKYDGSWSTPITTLNGANGQMCVFGGRLYISTVTSAVASMTTSEVLSKHISPNTIPYTIQLAEFGVGGSNANTITCMRPSSNKIWIGVTDYSSNSLRGVGRGAKVFEWDGVSTQANKVYYINDAIGVLAMVIKGDIPYIVDSNMRLLKFNGREFVEIARFPLRSDQYLGFMDSDPINRGIHPRGIIVYNNKINFLVNNILIESNNTKGVNENFPAGIWEFDESTGNLYHKNAISFHERSSGVFTDYGQNIIDKVGALIQAKNNSTASARDGELLCGVRFYTNATTTANGVFFTNSEDTLKKSGYFVTTKIESESVLDTWQKVFLKYKQLLDSSDKIVIKYRTTEVRPTPATITWTSTTTFTSTNNLSSYTAGDEVEITRGTGSGQIEHIASITESGGTYTVTLENVVTGASGTATARFQKWTKLGTIQNQTSQFSEFLINKKSTWIQFKVVMYFTGRNEVEELQIINEPYKLSA